MADLHHLYGSCACERNQYTIVIPPTPTKQVHVFFDNTAANRRSQATPLSAWLRIPLEWYHSSTFAQFPDETHSSIKRAFSDSVETGMIRRQFCGFCGTHLTAWSESSGGGSDVVNVTLGSLESGSLEVLEDLGIYDGDLNADEDAGTRLDDATASIASAAPSTPAKPPNLHQLRGRGLPYFEDMVEHSRLGRIRRQEGAHDSADGTRRVEWEVMDIVGEVPGSDEIIGGSDGSASGAKRARLGL